MNERRTNGSAREQAQKWFDALRAHLAAENAQSDIIERLRTWATLEDLMGDCPQLLPPLMGMAWQLRRQTGFAELFQTADGAVADDTTVALVPCGKSFDAIVLSHLHGAIRVYCERLQRTFLATERARHRPTGLAKVSFLAPLIRRLKKQRDQDFLEKYPQRGLYQALKPHLRHPGQFALIEALATLPTRTVMILGDATRGLTGDASIRNLAALEGSKCKFVTGLGRHFAETVIAGAETARTSGAEPGHSPHPPMSPPAVRTNLGEIAGVALSHLTADGLHLAKGAISVRDCAQDVVTKMSLPMGYGLWRVFADSEGAWNIAHCPPVLAQALGEGAARVHRKTSEALNSLPDQRVIEAVVAGLTQGAGRDDLIAWVASAHCAGLWGRVATEIKQAIAAQGEAAITPEAIAAYCQSLIPSFVALSGNGVPPPVAAVADPAPAAAVAQ